MLRSKLLFSITFMCLLVMFIPSCSESKEEINHIEEEFFIRVENANTEGAFYISAQAQDGNNYYGYYYDFHSKECVIYKLPCLEFQNCPVIALIQPYCFIFSTQAMPYPSPAGTNYTIYENDRICYRIDVQNGVMDSFQIPSSFALIGEYAAYDAVENEIALRCIDIASNTTENVFLDCESLKITQEHPEIEINSNFSINNADTDLANSSSQFSLRSFETEEGSHWMLTRTKDNKVIGDAGFVENEKPLNMSHVTAIDHFLLYFGVINSDTYDREVFAHSYDVRNGRSTLRRFSPEERVFPELVIIVDDQAVFRSLHALPEVFVYTSNDIAFVDLQQLLSGHPEYKQFEVRR